ncbi:hypothetical protein BD779DRAFT_565036 [Infundibulicybe gibba]|nr:hypothetical protein BD779DRAFT_565036 [Infundibulicybe gibba]
MTADRSNRKQSSGYSSDPFSPTISVIYQISLSKSSLPVERASHVFDSYPEYQCDQVNSRYPRSIHSQWIIPPQNDPLEWGHGQEGHLIYHSSPAYMPPNEEQLYMIQRSTGSLKPLSTNHEIHHTPQNQVQFQSPDNVWPVQSAVVHAVPSYPYQSYPSYTV